MRAREPAHSLEARFDQPLIGVIIREGGREIVRYFVDEAAADAATPPNSVQRALDLIGAWSDIDTPDALDVLDRMRHDSTPTPPIEDV